MKIVLSRRGEKEEKRVNDKESCGRFKFSRIFIRDSILLNQRYFHDRDREILLEFPWNSKPLEVFVCCLWVEILWEIYLETEFIS